LTFDDLTLEVALMLSVAYYGAAGDSAPAIPVDTQDLADCRRHVNNAIRMFKADAPPQGWRWARPTADLVLWPDVAVDSDVTATGVYDASTYTVITASEATFYPSMEGKSIVVTDTATYTIHTYVSSTVVWILGDNAFAGKTFSIASGGNFTLPKFFGGTHTGPITYGADSNTGATVEWTNESRIRTLREPSTQETGDPFLAAVRRMDGNARRWELMTYPTPAEEETVQFPYELHFDSLTTGTDLHPAGFQHDEAVKAACLAVAERDSEDVLGGTRWRYYRDYALPNAYKVDTRSAPRRLGYINERFPISQDDYRRYIERPTVTFNQ
jgi:hypothetical protein